MRKLPHKQTMLHLTLSSGLFINNNERSVNFSLFIYGQLDIDMRFYDHAAAIPLTRPRVIFSLVEQTSVISPVCESVRYGKLDSSEIREPELRIQEVLYC